MGDLGFIKEVSTIQPDCSIRHNKLSTVLFESFDLFCFITFSGGEEHLFQMPHPRFDILLIIIALLHASLHA